MVRAAFEGNGALFPAIAALCQVSRAWLTAQTKTAADKEIARIRFPMKLRFPQGSEISISGSPKYGVTAGSRLTNPELKAETHQQGLRPSRAVSACRPS
jgi:hypothetical protein